MVEDCGATYAHMDVSKCTHLVTTQSGITQGFLKGNSNFESDLDNNS
jgi:hypothetical protein